MFSISPINNPLITFLSLKKKFKCQLLSTFVNKKGKIQKKESGREDSNLRPLAPHSSAEVSTAYPSVHCVHRLHKSRKKLSIVATVSIVSTLFASKKASVKYFYKNELLLLRLFTRQYLTDASNRAQPEFSYSGRLSCSQAHYTFRFAPGPHHTNGLFSPAIRSGSRGTGFLLPVILLVGSILFPHKVNHSQQTACHSHPRCPTTAAQRHMFMYSIPFWADTASSSSSLHHG